MSAGELERPDPAVTAPLAIRAGQPEPLVVDGHVVLAAYRSPLDADPETGDYPTSLRGGVVTVPREIADIRRRVEYGALPWWRRAITPTPRGWRAGRLPPLALPRRAAAPIVPIARPLELTMIPTIVCRGCGTDAPNDEACGDPCCGRCSHPTKAVG